MNFSREFLLDFSTVLTELDDAAIERCAQLLCSLRERTGRLFILGIGGSAANASHAVNDFRKIVGIEAYTPTDNVAELTARINDEGWSSSFLNWLCVSNMSKNDLLMVLSVGGGSRDISRNIVEAVDYAWGSGVQIIGIVGRDGGFTLTKATECILIPTINNDYITPYAESAQAIIWHLLVNHPLLHRI